MQIFDVLVAVLEEQSGYFTKKVIYQALFAVILVGHVIRGKKKHPRVQQI